MIIKPRIKLKTKKIFPFKVVDNVKPGVASAIGKLVDLHKRGLVNELTIVGTVGGKDNYYNSSAVNDRYSTAGQLLMAAIKRLEG